MRNGILIFQVVQGIDPDYGDLTRSHRDNFYIITNKGEIREAIESSDEVILPMIVDAIDHTKIIVETKQIPQNIIIAILDKKVNENSPVIVQDGWSYDSSGHKAIVSLK